MVFGWPERGRCHRVVGEELVWCNVLGVRGRQEFGTHCNGFFFA